MSETDNKTQGQKPKISKWVKISFCCAVLGWLIPIAFLIIAEVIDIPLDNKGFNRFLILTITSNGLIIIALITGIVGLIQIVKSICKKESVKGVGYIITSFLAVLVYLTFMLMPYIAYIAHR